MAGFYLYTSNRMEVLADKLADKISKDPLPPLAQEIIIIPSAGMERFVAFALANKQKICANINFPFPNTFIHSIFKNSFPDISERSLFSPEMLTWKIMEFIPGLLNKNGFEGIKQYISNDPTDVKLYQICRKIADIFDQYTVFRHEMLTAWESGEKASGPTKQWQSILWLKIIEEVQDSHRVELKKMLFKKLKENSKAAETLPRRISLFSISYLPGFHLDILNALSHYTDINLYSLNPCKHFWDDIISEKSMAKKSTLQLKENRNIADFHFETGNPLLSSLGKYGKGFFTMLHNLECIEQSEFIESEKKSMLSILQSHILNLHSPESRVSVSSQDRSLQIHVCHSPLREIEVLHDNLIYFLEQDKNILPDDIVVMTPDIDIYTPFIHTVFDIPSDTATYIPYSIADTSNLNSSSIINDFFSILDIKKSRFAATAVLSILESNSIKNNFDLKDDDLSVIYTWVENTRIRWAIDKHDRERAGMPSTGQNTWQAGLDRLFMGYSMSADNEYLFNDILPYNSVEGDDIAILEKLFSFLKKLFDTAGQLDSNRTLGQWSEFLLGIITGFFSPDDSNVQYIESLKKTISDLSEQEQSSGFNREIPFTIIRSYLESSLSKKQYGRGFMAGGVTFCNMLPMRTVPFKIICLVGMNDRSFPRKDSFLTFDLIGSNIRAGDRSVRKEDRYCFLECILSSRDILYISYIGHNIKDNSLIPPCVLISELTDYLTRAFSLSGSESEQILEHITTYHHLNAFNREYFSGDMNGKFFSYSQENAEAAGADISESKPFIEAPLSIPEEPDLKHISIDELCSFFIHPVKHFLNNRIGIYPAKAESVIDDTESFSIDSLDKYFIEQELLEKRLSNIKSMEHYNAIKAKGILPHGTAGECLYSHICGKIDNFVSSIARINTEPSAEPYTDIDIIRSGFTITGRIGILTKDNLVHLRSARIKAKDRLRIWISHLMLNLSKDKNLPRTSMLIGIGKTNNAECISYAQVENGEEILDNLLSLYIEGSAKPLVFYPQTSFTFAEAVNRGKPQEHALDAARKNWKDIYSVYRESDDIYYSIYPKNIDTFDMNFAETALKIYEPIFKYESISEI